ncbi:GNAT family N-acetyltransferase [Ilumatobacter sp.]|uniref:GNAT family N-acetyltransferase n=1 Tax=Ilumatobacter sp. TaxID=1967498 RepID=UPI003751544C
MIDGADDRLPERIQTPRLLLRRWQHDEASMLDNLVESNVKHLRPWMPWIKFEPQTVSERVTLIETWTREWEDGGDVVLGTFLDGFAIGSCGLHRRVGPGALDIGYWIADDHTRRGFATEATSALTTTAFGVAGIERVEVHTDEANEASAGVPAKLGFRRDRVIQRAPEAPAESGRLIIWTMAKADWR